MEKYNILYFGAKSNRRYRRLTKIIRALTKIIRACALRIDLKIEMYLSHRMHQTSIRYNPNGYWSLLVTPIACGLKAPKWHGKNMAFLSICILLILPSVISNNKDLLKTRLICNYFVHISCKNDWNNLLS